MSIKPVWEYDADQWDALGDRERADAWGLVAESLKVALQRFDPSQPFAQDRWRSLQSSLESAIRERQQHLKKAWGLR